MQLPSSAQDQDKQNTDVCCVTDVVFPSIYCCSMLAPILHTVH